MLGRDNEFFSVGSSPEDNLRMNVIRAESKPVYEKELYKEAANRVIFDNCLSACGLTRTDIPNFNKHFYYNQEREQHCLQDCYNARM
mmetsp:Transcript_31153/g.30610  ORF Transcript_31153/g.30610 Transcript_31153/m.30610 type:complete len:87 (+) Transcript_31153:3-263(+)